jgi:glutamyl-tRNA reductase
MARTLIQLGITDREILVAARRRAGGEGTLAEAIVRGTSGLFPSASPVLLSTCERLEVYAIAGPDEARAIAGTLGRCLAAGAGTIALERRIGEAGAAHLFAVAAGLESRLVGEPHILGQVSRAAASRDVSRVPARLMRLFQDAVACGRRARAVSGLDRLAVSCVDLTIAQARKALPAGQGRAAVVGSGAIAREVAFRLGTAGFAVTVLARHCERAAENLPKGLDVAPLDQLAVAVASVDVLVAATSSPTSIVTASHIRNRQGPVVLIDLGLPSNIDPSVGLIPAVTLVTLDDLLQGQHRPEHVIARARAVVNARAARWSRRWLGSDAADFGEDHSRSTVA